MNKNMLQMLMVKNRFDPNFSCMLDGLILVGGGGEGRKGKGGTTIYIQCAPQEGAKINAIMLLWAYPVKSAEAVTIRCAFSSMSTSQRAPYKIIVQFILRSLIYRRMLCDQKIKNIQEMKNCCKRMRWNLQNTTIV